MIIQSGTKGSNSSSRSNVVR